MKTFLLIVSALVNLVGCMLSIIMCVSYEGDANVNMAWALAIVVSGVLSGLSIDAVLSRFPDEA